MSQLDLFEDKIWDYIVIGTGMGGGPIGLRLAQAGFSVLFVEKGRSPKKTDSIQGEFAEIELKKKPNDKVLERAGRFSQTIYDATTSTLRKLQPFLGQGVGGSSALYGMVLERFQPSDFKNWPISYQSFQNSYAEAEQLFRVRTKSSLQHPGNQKLQAYLKEAGLAPYALPLANENHPACGNCQSILCQFRCKNDSGKICIEPALNLYGACLLTDCEVQTIESSGSVATGVTVQQQNIQKTIHARHVILSAGAIASPLLLMKSASEKFPMGLGNQSGHVGRYLMRHLVDLYALRIDSNPENLKTKEIGLNDFYEHQGEKLGTVQSFGRLPPTEVILTQLEKNLQIKLTKLMFQFVKPFLRLILNQKNKDRLVMASIVEDSPQFGNRVWSENGKIFLSYQLSQNDRKKISVLRQRLKNLFMPLGLWFLAASEKNEMLAHACGTCRMGEDPALSVVSLDNKVHGMNNLYVVDSSFFPTSGGTNPALTIAANSLRVADLLIQQQKSKEPAKQTHPSVPESADHRRKE